MNRLIHQDKIYNQYEYSSEAEFEKTVVSFSKAVFGDYSIYIDVKKKIANDNIITIPDGYLIDFSFKGDPKLFIIENELVVHDPYRHIGQQLLKFAISYKVSGRKIKSFLLDNVLKNENHKKALNQVIKDSEYRNIDDLFESMIFDKPVSAIVVIDEVTSDLENVLSQLSMKTDIIEFQTFTNGGERIHKFTPFQQDLRVISESNKAKIPLEEIDTIVVPAQEEGFNQVFLGQNCWYAIRLSSSMINRLKYIAAYQVNPISAITYYAEIASIEKYKDTNKYIVNFKSAPKKIEPIKLPQKKSGLAPQSPRYTSFKRLLKAKTLNDVF